MRLLRLWLLVVLFGAATAGSAQTVVDPVSVSVHINSIPDLDAATDSFEIDAFLRFAWRDPTIDPTASVEMMNPARGWQARVTKVFDQPQQMADGRFYNTIRYQGRFTSPLSLADYPFESHRLRVIFRDRGPLTYRADGTAVTMDPAMTIGPYRAGTPLLVMSTASGPPAGFGWATGAQAVQAELVIPLRRKGAVFGVKTIMPVLVVVFAGLLALYLDHGLATARVGLLATALLSLIVLQLSTAPSANYLTMLDMIFVLGRLVLAAGLLRVVLSYFSEVAGRGEGALRTDRQVAGALAAALVLGTVAIALGHLAR